MAIEYNYDGPPSLEIYQDFVRSSTASANTQSVVVVAEHFDVVKKDYNPYGIDTEAYDANTGALITWETLKTTQSKIDVDSINVVLDDVHVSQKTVTGTLVNANSNKIKLTYAVNDKQFPLPVTVGDIIAVDTDDGYEMAEVISIESSEIVSTPKAVEVVGYENTYKPSEDNPGAKGSFAVDGKYDKSVDRTYFVQIESISDKDKTVTVNITTDDGMDGAESVVLPVGESVALANSGLTITADSTNFSVDCYYQIQVNAYVKGDPDIINISKIITGKADTELTLYCGKPYTASNTKYEYKLTDEGIKVSNLTLNNVMIGNVEGITSLVLSGNVFIEYRARTDKYVNKLEYISLSDGTDISKLIGYTGIENPLGAMVNVALKGGTSVYCTAVKSDSVEAYQKAFAFLSRSTDTYAVVIGSLRPDVIATLSTFVKAQADPAVANYKIGYYGLEDSAEVCVWDKYINDEGKEFNITATVTGKSLVSKYAGFVTKGIKVGDVVKMNIGVDASGDVKYKDLIIADVISDTECTVEFEGSFSRPMATVFSVYRTLDGQELVDALKKRVYINNHRCYCVFGDGIEIDGIKDAPAWLKAALPAGMRAGEYAHRPISNLSYSGCSANNKLNLSSAEQRDLASRGVWILANSTDGSVVYNYHQLSTDMSDKKYQEQSYTTNYDNISRGVRALMSPYYGNSNISDALFQKIEADLYAFLHGKCTNAPNVQIGSQLVSFTNLRLEQDTVNKDHVYLYVDYTMPAPFNHVTVKQRLI